MNISPRIYCHQVESDLTSVQDSVFDIKELFFKIASLTTPYQYGQLTCVNKNFHKLGMENFGKFHTLFSLCLGLEQPGKSPQDYVKGLLHIFKIIDQAKHLAKRLKNNSTASQEQLANMEISLNQKVDNISKKINGYLCDSRENFVLAKAGSRALPRLTFKHLDKFNLSQENCLEVAKECLVRDCNISLLNSYSASFNSLPQEICFELVKRDIQIKPNLLGLIIVAFNKLSQEQRFELALLCVKTIPDNLLKYLGDFDLTFDQRCEITNLCIQNSVSHAVDKVSEGFTSIFKSFFA